jgi:hypothetical protein
MPQKMPIARKRKLRRVARRGGAMLTVPMGYQPSGAAPAMASFIFGFLDPGSMMASESSYLPAGSAVGMKSELA